MTEPGGPRGVGKTALGMAMIRAGESRRADRLFSDPYAQAFADAVPDAFAAEQASAAAKGPMASLGAAFAFGAVLRTRFFDDFLLAAAGAGCRQVVLLAAGLDTRAFRLSWPAGTRLYELDMPDVLDFKEAVLARHGARPSCERAVIPADLRASWTVRLAEAGFDPAVPTAWLPEGLLSYLTAEEAARLLTDAGILCPPGSRLSFERGGSSLDRATELPAMRPYAALWKGGLGENAADWLASHGWQPELHDVADLAESYGRPAPGISGGFVTAVRRAA